MSFSDCFGKEENHEFSDTDHFRLGDDRMDDDPDVPAMRMTRRRLAAPLPRTAKRTPLAWGYSDGVSNAQASPARPLVLFEDTDTWTESGQYQKKEKS